MKIAGLHWAAHIIYLSAIAGVWCLWKQHMEEAAFLNTDIGQVQGLGLPLVSRMVEWPYYKIIKSTGAYKTPKNEENGLAASRAVKLIDRFSKKCEMAQARLNNGTRPDQIDWPADLLNDYYHLGDSLNMFLPQNPKGQEWLDRCLFSDYRACPPKQLASWLAGRDTADARKIVQNLHLKAELALYTGLHTLEKQTQSDDVVFDAMLPVISYTDCPRAGQPFEAKVWVAPYSFAMQHVKAKINGQLVPVEKGLVHYETRSRVSDSHPLRVEFIVTNPLTGVQNHYSLQHPDVHK